MLIKVNGENREFAVESLSVTELLKSLDLKLERIAVELNKSIVSKISFDSTALCDNDSVEIVQFVGGG